MLELFAHRMICRNTRREKIISKRMSKPSRAPKRQSELFLCLYICAIAFVPLFCAIIFCHYFCAIIFVPLFRAIILRHCSEQNWAQLIKTITGTARHKTRHSPKKLGTSPQKARQTPKNSAQLGTKLRTTRKTRQSSGQP